MVGAGINDGDLVYIKTQSDVESGEIAVVLIDNEEATLKRVFKANNSIILHAENPRMPDRMFAKKDVNIVKIQGKAISVKAEVL